MGLIERADAFAERAHAGQLRGDGKTPYIAHPRAVARILRDEAGITNEATLAAALLHDTIEDCDVTWADLASEFGQSVANAVSELTNDPIPFGHSKAQMQAAKARRMSPRAAMIKTADKIANLRDLIAAPPVGWSDAKRRRTLEDARQVVAAMAHRHPELDRLFEQAHGAAAAKMKQGVTVER